MNKPLAYTLGEPSGIGADIIIRLAHQKKLDDIVCVGDKITIQERAKQIGLPINYVNNISEVSHKGDLCVADISVKIPNAKSPKVENVDGIMNMLDTAIKGCVDKKYAAMVTGPIHKEIIAQKYDEFCGHTEYLGQKITDLIGDDCHPIMMLASQQMRVALMTTHLPLQAVSKSITKEKIIDKVMRINTELRIKCGIKQPKILICGLNPHAGEGGLLGREEIEIIEPALLALQQQGIDVEGPFSADTIFSKDNLKRCDLFLAMYHDQGLPVLKTLSFGEAANITLGLPIIRTSVDHGTAIDLVGNNNIKLGSLITAIDVAKQMVKSIHLKDNQNN